jgi:hypothetical protein|tara:strand:+ start:258 stop:659 length:402 start_codon:yes stop_codon:yes gene_type:complete
MNIKRGRCLCSKTTFEYTGSENWCGHCHCESCRRNTSSAFTTFFGVPREAYHFTGAKPGVYESSKGVRRLFCTHCGTPMAFDADRYPNEILFYVVSLENPEELAPSFHLHFDERLSWTDIGDDLPRSEPKIIG